MHAVATPPQSAAANSPRAVLAGWLTVLLVGIFCLNTAGGWVRLSGAGVAIPHWPVIELEQGRKTVLPPLSEAGWTSAYEAWAGHQVVLRARIAGGELRGAALGRQPGTMAEFRSMFLTEWFHRLLAVSVGLVALACLVTVLRDRTLRARIGTPMVAANALIVVQAVLGGALVRDGTNTHWLFVHQGNAALILACVLIAVLRLLAPGTDELQLVGSKRQPSDEPKLVAPRRLVILAVLATWLMLILGGLLAASRHNLPSGGLLGLDAGPAWWQTASLVTNLLDNASLHHLAHRIGAVVTAGLVVAALVVAHRRGAPERTRLALSVAGTFVALQAVLGLAAAVMPAGEVVVPLAHLFLGHVLFLVLVLAAYDVRHGEPVAGPA